MRGHALLQEHPNKRETCIKTPAAPSPNIQQPELRVQVKPSIRGRPKSPLNKPVNLINPSK